MPLMFAEVRSLAQCSRCKFAAKTPINNGNIEVLACNRRDCDCWINEGNARGDKLYILIPNPQLLPDNIRLFVID
jgi:hypothetical protein